MTYTRVSKAFTRIAFHAVKGGRLVALAVAAAFLFATLQPAQAQSSDRWKSIAIIGGSTAAGAYIGHKVAGGTGAMVGAGVGATVGYEVDKRRRANEYYNQYGDNGYYGNSGPYYGNNDPYYGNGGYYSGPYSGPTDGYPYPSGYQGNSYSAHSNRFAKRH